MSILGLQQRRREVGRLRLGTKAKSGAPKRLETWRLTSSHSDLIEAAAAQYGGVMAPWDEQWEVITETDTLPVVVPAQDIDPRLELWSAGGLNRHCDGEVCWVAEKGGVMVEQPCMCQELAERECKPHTRIKFQLWELPEALGVWGFNSTGWNVASELVPDAQMLAGRMVPVDLRIEQRVSKKKGEVTHKFAVPVLSTSISLAQLMGGGGAVGNSDGLTLPTSTITALPSPKNVVEVLPPERKGDSVVGELAAESALEGGEAEPGAAPRHATGKAQVSDLVTRIEEQAWVDLMIELEQEPHPRAKMDDKEVPLRSLFRRMEQVGLWEKNEEGVDALHQALRVRGWAHIGDMVSTELTVFTADTWEAARRAVKEAE